MFRAASSVLLLILAMVSFACTKPGGYGLILSLSSGEVELLRDSDAETVEHAKQQVLAAIGAAAR